MDNNSTFVPGIHNAAEPVENFNPYAQPGETSGTYIPGMQAKRISKEEQSTPSSPVQQGNRPVVGFLYSISNGGMREYWPIYVGTNVIGRDSDVDIQLKEATVSGRHAKILVRELRTGNGLTATIQDLGSKTGILVNEQDPGYELVKCCNGDIIIIGNNYRMLVIMIDTAAAGLFPSDDFLPVAAPVQEELAVETPIIPQGRNPYDRNSNIQGGTVDLSGARSFDSSGGTMIME